MTGLNISIGYSFKYSMIFINMKKILLFILLALTFASCGVHSTCDAYSEVETVEADSLNINS